MSKKTDAYWRQHLSPESYRVLREKGTESPFSGAYNHHDSPGIYHCAGCHAPLFLSEDKFDSRSGWPSFVAPLEGDAITQEIDHALGDPRMEVMCQQCGGHLGHVFEEGPKPTGLRYCINSVALDFIPKK